MIETILGKLEQRLGGRLYAKQRLGIETDHEAQILGQGLTFFHIENWYSIHSVIRTLFKLTGLYWRGRANAARVQVRHNDVRFKKLPSAFDGFTLLLHISDFHADMNDGAMGTLEEILPDLSYDLCVLTGIIVAQHSANLMMLFHVCDRSWHPLSDQSMVCSAITTPSAWSPASRP